jgi:phenylpyruvate tautomerase PptA (4-oxalocrotonate tautomerase family)
MPVININVRDKDMVQKVTSEHGIPATFYTIEKNESMVQVDIEASAEGMWYIARAVEAELVNKEINKLW